MEQFYCKFNYSSEKWRSNGIDIPQTSGFYILVQRKDGETKWTETRVLNTLEPLTRRVYELVRHNTRQIEAYSLRYVHLIPSPVRVGRCSWGWRLYDTRRLHFALLFFLCIGDWTKALATTNTQTTASFPCVEEGKFRSRIFMSFWDSFGKTIHWITELNGICVLLDISNWSYCSFISWASSCLKQYHHLRWFTLVPPDQRNEFRPHSLNHLFLKNSSDSFTSFQTLYLPSFLNCLIFGRLVPPFIKLLWWTSKRIPIFLSLFPWNHSMRSFVAQYVSIRSQTVSWLAVDTTFVASASKNVWIGSTGNLKKQI